MVCKTVTRRACEDDLSGIMNLHQDARSHEPHIWKVYLELEPDSGIVAETDGSMSGCVHVFLRRETGWIEGLYVHPKYRGTGVGKRLLEGAFSLIRAESGKLALIDALMDNMPAIRLYQKLGFENVYVRSHLAVRMETFPSTLHQGDMSFRRKHDMNTLWSSINDSDAYLARHGIIMGCYRGWKLAKEDLEDFEIVVCGKESVLVFREIADLELAPEIHGLFEKQYLTSKYAKRICTRFEINLVSGGSTGSKEMISQVLRRAKKARSHLVDIWTWKQDPLSRLYDELGFENWGSLYLMQKKL